MQEALPYKPWTPPPLRQQPPLNIIAQSPPPRPIVPNGSKITINGRVGDMVSENAVIVFGRRGCCMSHVVKRLLHALGVNPAVYEVEDDEDENRVIDELEAVGTDGIRINDQRLQFPAVFIGGRLFGGLDRIMATHITGELTPVLKQAGALWL